MLSRLPSAIVKSALRQAPVRAAAAFPAFRGGHRRIHENAVARQIAQQEEAATPEAQGQDRVCLIHRRGIRALNTLLDDLLLCLLHFRTLRWTGACSANHEFSQLPLIFPSFLKSMCVFVLCMSSKFETASENVPEPSYVCAFVKFAKSTFRSQASSKRQVRFPGS